MSELGRLRYIAHVIREINFVFIMLLAVHRRVMMMFIMVLFQEHSKSKRDTPRATRALQPSQVHNDSTMHKSIVNWKLTLQADVPHWLQINAWKGRSSILATGRSDFFWPPSKLLLICSSQDNLFLLAWKFMPSWIDVLANLISKQVQKQYYANHKLTCWFGSKEVNKQYYALHICSLHFHKVVQL